MSNSDPIILTVTSDGISPSQAETNSSGTITFQTAGQDPPRSVTVTSANPNVKHTMLLGGEDNTYPVPGTYKVYVRFGMTVDVFTVTAGEGKATIRVRRGIGGVMREPNDSTK